MKTFDKARFDLMKGVYQFLVKKNMAFCFLENGELVSINQAMDYIADNHLNEYEKEV